MGNWKGNLAALWLLFCVALAPAAQVLTHPPIVAQAHSPAEHSLAEHSLAERSAHSDHAHAHDHAHSHGAAHPVDHDHIPALILPTTQQPALWPQAQPSLTHFQTCGQAKAAALRRPPRAHGIV